MVITKIKKRTGLIEIFDSKKIHKAIEKASFASNVKLESKTINNIVKEIIKDLEKEKSTPTIEHIQDLVERKLFENDLFKVARNFIRYREKHELLRSDSNAYVDSISTVGEYVEQNDWRVNENANQGYSLGGLILNTAGKLTANYWLNHVYSPEIKKAHKNADFHIHDLGVFGGYCAGWSLRSLLNEGFNGVEGKCESEPPKHFSSAVSQMVNFLGTMQNEWAGAQSFSSFDTYLAPYIYKDKLNFKQIKQFMQQFIFNMNVPSRWGSQCPFTNLTFDWTVPDDLKDQVPMCDNEPLIKKNPKLTYKNFTKEMLMINKAFLEVMVEGDKKGRVFTFPIPTYNITEDFNWDNENSNLLFEVTAKYGIPYFQNFIGSQYKFTDNGKKVKNKEAYTPGAVRSMCCRLQLDLNELLKRGNGLFGSAEMTGSIGVVTINAARLGYLYKDDKDKLFLEVEKLMILAKESLEMKRKIIDKNMKRGLYPFTKRYLGHLRNHFSTIGVNGVNEMIRNFTNCKEDISTKNGMILAIEFLEFMRDKMKEFQKETGNLYNLEATPAEGTTYRFAKEDRQRFKNIIQAGFEKNIYYTNSAQLPVGFTNDPFEALDLQDSIQCKFTGGTVLHLYLGEKVSNVEACKKLVKKILTNYKLPYITITPTFSICPKHGYLNGEHQFCPTCDEELAKSLNQSLSRINLLPTYRRSVCEIWTRVMGYYRPVSQFNIGKKGEFIERVYYKENENQKVQDKVSELVNINTNLAIEEEEEEE